MYFLSKIKYIGGVVMNRKRKLILLSIVFLISTIFNQNILKAKVNIDINQQIIKKVDGKKVECGVRGTFYSNKPVDLFTISKDLFFKSTDCNEEIKKERFHGLVYRNNERYLYIESFYEEEKYKVQLNLISNKQSEDINLLKKEIADGLHKSIDSIKWEEYVKYKIDKRNINDVQSTTLSELKNLKAINIERVKIDNGISLVYYLPGNYKKINTAVCTYSSGTYLIIATPEIYISY